MLIELILTGDGPKPSINECGAEIFSLLGDVAKWLGGRADNTGHGDIVADLLILSRERMLLVHLPVPDGERNVHLVFELAGAEVERDEMVVVREDELKLQVWRDARHVRRRSIARINF